MALEATERVLQDVRADSELSLVESRASPTRAPLSSQQIEQELNFTMLGEVKPNYYDILPGTEYRVKPGSVCDTSAMLMAEREDREQRRAMQQHLEAAVVHHNYNSPSHMKPIPLAKSRAQGAARCWAEAQRKMRAREHAVSLSDSSRSGTMASHGKSMASHDRTGGSDGGKKRLLIPTPQRAVSVPPLEHSQKWDERMNPPKKKNLMATMTPGPALDPNVDPASVWRSEHHVPVHTLGRAETPPVNVVDQTIAAIHVYGQESIRSRHLREMSGLLENHRQEWPLDHRETSVYDSKPSTKSIEELAQEVATMKKIALNKSFRELSEKQKLSRMSTTASFGGGSPKDADKAKPRRVGSKVTLLDGIPLVEEGHNTTMDTTLNSTNETTGSAAVSDDGAPQQQQEEASRSPEKGVNPPVPPVEEGQAPAQPDHNTAASKSDDVAAEAQPTQSETATSPERRAASPGGYTDDGWASEESPSRQQQRGESPVEDATSSPPHATVGVEDKHEVSPASSPSQSPKKDKKAKKEKKEKSRPHSESPRGESPLDRLSGPTQAENASTSHEPTSDTSVRATEEAVGMATGHGVPAHDTPSHTPGVKDASPRSPPHSPSKAAGSVAPVAHPPIASAATPSAVVAPAADVDEHYSSEFTTPPVSPDKTVASDGMVAQDDVYEAPAAAQPPPPPSAEVQEALSRQMSAEERPGASRTSGRRHRAKKDGAADATQPKDKKDKKKKRTASAQDFMGDFAAVQGDFTTLGGGGEGETYERLDFGRPNTAEEDPYAEDFDAESPHGGHRPAPVQDIDVFETEAKPKKSKKAKSDKTDKKRRKQSVEVGGESVESGQRPASRVSSDFRSSRRSSQLTTGNAELDFPPPPQSEGRGEPLGEVDSEVEEAKALAAAMKLAKSASKKKKKKSEKELKGNRRQDAFGDEFGGGDFGDVTVFDGTLEDEDFPTAKKGDKAKGAGGGKKKKKKQDVFADDAMGMGSTLKRPPRGIVDSEEETFH